MSVVSSARRPPCWAAPLWVLAALDTALARVVVAAVALDPGRAGREELLCRLRGAERSGVERPYGGALAHMRKAALKRLIAAVVEAGLLEEREDGALEVGLAGEALLAGWSTFEPGGGAGALGFDQPARGDGATRAGAVVASRRTRIDCVR